VKILTAFRVLSVGQVFVIVNVTDVIDLSVQNRTWDTH